MEIMTCKLIAEQVDDFLDGELAETERLAVETHVTSCASCEALVVEARKLQDMLRDYGESTMPTMDAAFFDRSIARAAHEGTKRQRSKWIMTGFGGAVAAATALWIVSSVFLTTPDITEPSIPSVTMTLEQPRTLNLVFASAVALENATMTVLLPEGVEVEGFAGQREITWMTSLDEGRNILPLTLIATSPVGGEILATLRHEDDDKTFRLQVSII
jgi:anti-sigma factor RsiW